MNQYTKLSIVIFIMIITIANTSCNRLYKAGNLVVLSYPIVTPIRSEIIERYLDTLIRKKGYNPPDGWLYYDKLVKIDSVKHRRVYFKSGPEEMYLITFSGMPLLNDVYNPLIRQGEWVANRNLMSEKEELRVRNRFKTEILDSIEKMAKRDGLPDSVIYR